MVQEIQVRAVIGEPPSGVAYVRFLQPFGLRTLGRQGTLRRTPQGLEPDPGWLDGASVLIFPRMVSTPRILCPSAACGRT